jgi:hypothetical protein
LQLSELSEVAGLHAVPVAPKPDCVGMDAVRSS